jgi:hypothetical protein
MYVALHALLKQQQYSLGLPAAVLHKTHKPLGCSCVAAATTDLSTSDNIVLLRQNVDQLSLSFITPLGAQHYADLRREPLAGGPA